MEFGGKGKGESNKSNYKISLMNTPVRIDKKTRKGNNERDLPYQI